MPDAERWDALPKRLPDWFHDAPLGIFIHWGAYAVPAWAELGAELGAADDGADQWRPDAVDPAAWTELFRRAGADYLVLTTKHHDGITLWDAPGTGERNTVRRGPRRDLVGEISGAAREAGMRFGVYYSGGL